MTSLLLELSIRAALIALGTAVMLRVFRIRGAAARHAAWTAVVIAMLCLPLARAGRLTLAVPMLEPAVAPIAPTSDARTPPALSEPPQVPTIERAVPVVAGTASAEAPQADNWQSGLVILYIAGVVLLLLRLALGTIQANRLRRTAVVEDGRLTSDRCSTPITVGWLAPSLILPRGWRQWQTAKLQAVVTHEQEHARRHDPLFLWLALLNRAVFWFHPLAWWLERRIAALAEEACDAAVIAAGHSPQDYSAYLLDMARDVASGRGRVRLGMAMPGSDLKGRLGQILRGLPAPRLSRTRMACTAACWLVSSAFFAAATPSNRGVAQSQERTVHKFDVVSIKPCPNLPPAGNGRAGAPGAAQTSPGYVIWECVTLATLIDRAYTGPESPLLNNLDDAGDDSPKRVRGGPSWVYSDRFTIEAKASGEAGIPSPYGRVQYAPPAMNQALRAVLADRFQLSLRRMTEERAMYALTLAPAGLNTTRVMTTAADACWIWDPPSGRIKAPAGFEQKPVCGNVRSPWAQGGRHSEFTGHSMAAFAEHLSGLMGRYVINLTGVEGMFNFTLDYEPDGDTPGAGPPADATRGFGGFAGGTRPTEPSRQREAGHTIFSAIAELGLKLEPVKGQAEYLRIESAARPKSDEAVTQQEAQSARSRDQQAPSGLPGSRMQITFEAVAIRPCDVAAQGDGRGGGEGTSPRYAITPGYVRFGCATLEFMIEQAWGGRANNALLNTLRDVGTRDLDRPRRIRGGPSWIDDDRFEIEIRISGDTTSTTGSIRRDEVANAMAPALQAMLVDRFKLKLRKETEQRPMYALSVVPGGHKLKPFAAGDCVQWKEGMPRPSRMGLLDGRWACGMLHETMPIALQARVRAGEMPPADQRPRPDRRIEGYGITVQALVARLASLMDLYVMDRSGVTGQFTFAFEYTANENTPRTGWGMNVDQPAWPQNNVIPGTVGKDQTIFKALEAVGLRLEPTRGPSEYLFVENAQRPRTN